MKNPSIFGFGLLIWVIPFFISMFLYPLRMFNRPFFQSLMSDILVISIIFAVVLFVQKVKFMTLKQSLKIGLFWLFINIILDLVIFIFGPIHMTVFEYLSEIGTAYLMIPLITMGFVYALKHKKGGIL